MMRSMFSGVSGLRNHQTRMDVIGNNIANVNTVGFKASRVTFRQMFSQTLQGASRPTNDRGGTNPMQVGLGMRLGSITPTFTPGNVQTTGSETDLALAGNGFFILRDGNRLIYTRAGNFIIDGEGYLVDAANGLRVQGWMASSGVLPTPGAGNLRDIRIRLGEAIPARATTRVELADNLDAAAQEGDEVRLTLDLWDSLGRPRSVELVFTRTAADNHWNWAAYYDGTKLNNGAIRFGADGSLVNVFRDSFTIPAAQLDGASAMTVNLNFSGLTQYAAPTTVKMISQDGYPAGELQRFSIDTAGVITGAFSNGITWQLAQVALAGFTNPAGLIDQGGGLFMESNNSGARVVGAAGTSGLGDIVPSSLEMSNVDLSQEFTDMIVTQRGFQANARVITTSDEMLQELVNLRR
nr:flagellar hook-basal body protein [Bacillota bacterium]